MERTAHTIRIVIPGTVDKDKPASKDMVTTERRRAARLFANLFGGYTATQGIGGWIDEIGELVEEPVWIIESQFQDYPADPKEWKVASVVRHAIGLADRMEQDCVAVSIDGRLHLINRGEDNEGFIFKGRCCPTWHPVDSEIDYSAY